LAKPRIPEGTTKPWDVTTFRTTLTVPLPQPVHQIVSVTTDQIIVLESGYLIAVGGSPHSTPDLSMTMSRTTAGLQRDDLFRTPVGRRFKSPQSDPLR